MDKTNRYMHKVDGRTLPGNDLGDKVVGDNNVRLLSNVDGFDLRQPDPELLIGPGLALPLSCLYFNIDLH